MVYGILMKSMNNISYQNAYIKMCRDEISIVLKALSVDFHSVEVRKLHKGSYMMLNCEPLSETALKALYQLSFFYMLFQIDEDKFNPILFESQPLFEDDISTRLKYNGKTNEVFTRQMLNLGIYSSDFSSLPKLNLLDPMCGKGTTLFEGLISGCDVYGTEKNKHFVSDIKVYFSKYLQELKYKYEMEQSRLVVKKKNIGETLTVEFARNKEELKAEQKHILKVFRGDALQLHDAFKKNFFHTIVADLPYGIHHIGEKSQVKARDLRELLKTALPIWGTVLKKGGTLVLGWNTYTNKREEFVALLDAAGFTVFDQEEYLGFEHRVSQAITRDIIVAKK